LKEIYPEDAAILAPMSGFTDLPFRRAARHFGCRFAFTEMVDVSSLAYAPERTKSVLLRGDDEPFLGVQLVGSNLENARKSTLYLNQFNFDVLDLNMGCPVPKVLKNAAGAWFSRHIDEAVRFFETVKSATHFPLTAKIRVASFEDPAPTLALVRALENAGADAVTIHGRTQEKIYAGPVSYSVIAACRATLKIPVIANGGGMDVASCRQLKQKTGCSRIMVARGAQGNPWIFASLAEGHDRMPNRTELNDVMTEHVAGLCALYGEEAGMKIARKIIHDYLKGRGFSGSARDRASHLCTFAEYETFCRACAE